MILNKDDLLGQIERARLANSDTEFREAVLSILSTLVADKIEQAEVQEAYR